MAKRSQVQGNRPRSGGRRSPAASKRSPMLLWGIVGGALLLVGALILLQSVLARPQVVTGLAGDRAAWGPADAPVKILNFSNFGCSHCRTFALEQGEQMRAEYEATGKVRFEFKHFKLGDPSTTEAANASECAADQGKFWDYHNTLFAKQGTTAAPFTKANLKQYGRDLGLDTTTFNACVDNGRQLNKVSRDSDEGQSRGVQGTPTFFINGRKIVGDQPYAEFKKVIDAALLGS